MLNDSFITLCLTLLRSSIHLLLSPILPYSTSRSPWIQAETLDFLGNRFHGALSLPSHQTQMHGDKFGLSSFRGRLLCEGRLSSELIGFKLIPRAVRIGWLPSSWRDGIDSMPDQVYGFVIYLAVYDRVAHICALLILLSIGQRLRRYQYVCFSTLPNTEEGKHLLGILFLFLLLLCARHRTPLVLLSVTFICRRAELLSSAHRHGALSPITRLPQSSQPFHVLLSPLSSRDNISPPPMYSPPRGLTSTSIYDDSLEQVARSPVSEYNRTRVLSSSPLPVTPSLETVFR